VISTFGATQDVAVVCISHKRPGNVRKMLEIMDCEVTFQVERNQWSAYSAAGATSLGRGVPGWAEQLNAAMDYWWASEDTWLCLVDDDLRGIKWADLDERGKWRTRTITGAVAIDRMVEALRARDYARLAGPLTSDNPLGIGKQLVSTGVFVSSAMMVLRPSQIRFDTTLKVKGDYDFCLQHMTQHGAALRVNQILPKWEYLSNPGGLQDSLPDRIEANQQAIKLLLDRWPGILRPNPRRPGEILLRT
jgi:hypothetical protein